MSSSSALHARTPESLSFEENAYRKAVRRIVPLFIIGFLLAYLDRVNISFAKLQMQSDLGLSNAAYGLGASIFFVGYFLFEVPSNLILERVGARKWITRIMVTWGLASALMAFVKTETWFYVLRFMLGVTEAGFLPGVILYFTYWFPAPRRARINALFMLSIPISGVLGGPLAGFVMSHFSGVADMAGWQWLFLLEGGVTMLFGIVIFTMLDDRITDAKWLSAAEKKLLQANLAKEVHRTEHNTLQALKQPATLLLCLIYLLILMGFYGLTFWMPQLIKNTGISSAMSVGLLSAIPYAAAGIGMVLVGRSSDRSGERLWHLALPVAIGGTGYLLSAHFANDTVAAMASLVVASVGVMSCLPVFWALPPLFLQGTAAAAGIALINCVGNLGGVISPYLVGKVVDMTGSPSQGLIVIAVAMGCAAVLTLLFMRGQLAKMAR